MNMLAIDTSTDVLGVAIMKKNTLVADVMTNIKKDHSSRLMPAIVKLMEEVNMQADDLNQIVVAGGPGSYTGTRIGVTTAKTMAWALNIPICTVSSLKTLAYNGILFDGYICPFFDARRQAIFTGLYKTEKGKLSLVKAERNIAMEKWLEELAVLDEQILFLSPNIATFEKMIRHTMNDNAYIPGEPTHLPKAANLFLLNTDVEYTPVHHVHPNYLRITEAEAKLKQQKDDKQNG